jgi:hypothetical protein
MNLDNPNSVTENSPMHANGMEAYKQSHKCSYAGDDISHGKKFLDSNFYFEICIKLYKFYCNIPNTLQLTSV